MKEFLQFIITIIFVAIVLITIICLWLNRKELKNTDLTDSTINRSLSNDATFYERYIKRFFDIIFAFLGIVITSPFTLTAGLFICIEDSGRPIFKQKRVGINKSHFYIHKLRSMRQNTGDIPTHLLSKEQRANTILKVGRFIRKTSIDELPQLIDILRGRMTLIGPRPALWNQYDLIAERDKYGANDVRPGLTGWAQINGRDSISIEWKASLDGEYRQTLRRSSLDGLKMDLKCFFGTIKSVATSDGVVEGGTGSIHPKVWPNYTKGKDAEELIGNIGFGRKVEINQDSRKKVLITGKDSYIGQSFIEYAKEHYWNNFEIEELDMLDGSWRERDFSGIDTVFHVAGIAHADVGNVSDDYKQKYYRINTELAVEVAKKAKQGGVGEFIFMSSMIVYGDSAPYGQKKIVTMDTVPCPANFYGDSKLQADVAVRELADDSFKVIVLRPPMVYGRGSKGNYPLLAKLAKKLPVFPKVENQRSMLYIVNLCEFLCQIMLIEEIKQNATVLIPQNAEWTNTSDMVSKIAKASGKRMRLLKVFKPFVFIGGKMPGRIGTLVNKAFGNNCYEHEMSMYEGIEYQRETLADSISETEKNTN